MGASPIIAPPQPALSPAAKKTRRPTINRSPAIPKIPKILQILLQTIRPFPRRKKDPPPNHQPLARNPENPPKSCKSCFRQSALSPPQKRPAAQPSTARPQSRKSPKILQILLQTIRPFPAAKRIPPTRHQPPIARNPENLPKSCKSCFRQSALSPPQKRPAAQPSTASPAIPKISPKSCKSCFRQSALSPAAKKTRRPTISPAIPKSPQILQILLQTTSTPNPWDPA